MLKVINVVGARPNFMKMAPIIEAMNRSPEQFRHLLVHTGQHYDEKMSRSFFSDLARTARATPRLWTRLWDARNGGKVTMLREPTAHHE